MIGFAGRERSFCGSCGTPLMFFDPGLPHIFEVSTNSLDDPGPHRPGDECWTCDELGWLRSEEDLPRFDRESPVPGAD